jgi:hypothetical protein
MHDEIDALKTLLRKGVRVATLNAPEPERPLEPPDPSVPMEDQERYPGTLDLRIAGSRISGPSQMQNYPSI